MDDANGSLRRTDTIVLCGILALAAILRFAGLGRESLWLDEGYSVRVASGPVASVLAGAGQDIHPPLYYLLLHGWMRLAGHSEAAVRSLSAVAGCLTVAIAWMLGRRLLEARAGLIAALLVALSG